MSEASNLIRDSIAAMADTDRLFPWRLFSVSGRGYVETDRGMVVADCGHHAQPTATFIALMQPEVAAAVADLLDAIRDWQRIEYGSRSTAAAGVAAATDALEAAITRGSA